MENSQQIILSEIKDMISSVHRQIHELENRLGELEVLMEKTKEEPQVPASDYSQMPEEKVCGSEIETVPESEANEVIGSDASEVIASEANEDSVPETLTGAVAEKRPVVLDVMTAREPWRTDRPGSEINDIRSAISLNDRVLFINFLFEEDSALFSETIGKFDSMNSLDEVVGYISEHFPKWDMQSEVVYRFIMAVRRKLR